MKTSDLATIVDRLGLPPDAVAIGGPGGGECYVVEAGGSDWLVYYSERGLRRQERRFASEADACRYLVGWLIDDVVRWAK